MKIINDVSLFNSLCKPNCGHLFELESVFMHFYEAQSQNITRAL